MTKTIVVPCVVAGVVTPFEFKVGMPAEGSKPIQFQQKWFTTAKEGSVPPHILKILDDLYKLSLESKVPFEDLCEYAFTEKAKQDLMKNEGNK